ncbi:MAG: PCRF domain-containing protein, partial [Thiobacillus sp.]
MKASLADKLARADERLEELDALLSQPEIAGDMESYRKLTREHADLTPVVALYRKYRQVEADQRAAEEMLADPDMRELAEAEL